MSSINLNNSSLTESGTLRFSGLSSGVDFQSTIDAIITARRQPITNIQDKITLTDSRKTAMQELQGLATTFTTSLNELRGNNSFFATDVFKTKQAFATSAPTDTAPGGHTPTAAGSLLGITTSTSAATGSHRITVQQVAKAHQIRSDSFNSLTDDMTTLGVTPGTMTLNGQAIVVSGSDTLADVRDKINVSGAGVTATIVSASDTSHYLVLNSDETGSTNAMAFTGDFTFGDSLGLTQNDDGTIKTTLATAQNAIIDVNGITGIERSSNTIDDVIEGLTLSVFAAETDTEITIDIENDLSQVKTKIGEFVDSYNAIRDFITDQRTESDRDGDGDEEFGVLAFDGTMTQISQRMGQLVSQEIQGLADGYQSLSQIGISINEDFKLEVNDSDLDNKLLNNVEDVRKLFGFDFQSSDSRVTFISHDGSPTYTVDGSNAVEPYYLNIGGIDAGGQITSATISTSSGNGTVNDGSVSSLAGKVLTISDSTGANGLTVLYNGEDSSGSVEDIELRYTRGVADQLFYFFDDLTKAGGSFDQVTEQFDVQKEDYEAQITTLEARIEVTRASLEARFIAMETALAQLNSTRDTLTQYTDALNGNNS
jgi:flagellar hook-associated protein 2